MRQYKALLFIFTCIIPCALLADIKIGYVNSNRIMAEFEPVRDIQIELEKEQRKLEVEFNRLLGTIDSLKQDYERQRLLMSDDRRMTRENEIVNLEKNALCNKNLDGQGAIDHFFEIGSVQRHVVVPIESAERLLDGHAHLQVYHSVLLIATHGSLHRNVPDLFSRAFVRDERRIIRIPAEVVPETPQLPGEGHVDAFRENVELVAQSLAVDRRAHFAERVDGEAANKLVRRNHTVPVGVAGLLDLLPNVIYGLYFTRACPRHVAFGTDISII